jgi:hypothetical protein
MFVVGMAVVCSALLAAPFAADAQEGEGGLMTQGQLAQMLVRKLGLINSMGPNPSDMECIMALSQAGIFPSPTLTPTEQNPTPGWSLDPNTPVTVADLAVILVRALGLEDTVQGDKSDPQNWMDALAVVNVPTDSVQGGAQVVTPLPQVLQEIVASQTSGNPLSRQYLPDSRGGQVVDTITFPDIQSSAKELADEGKPVPITPT